MRKWIHFGVASLIISSLLLGVAYCRNVRSRVQVDNLNLINSWLSSFKAEDFEVCDRLNQARSYRLSPDLFNNEYSSLIYEADLKFLARNMKVIKTQSVADGVEVTVSIPVCSTSQIDMESISADVSKKMNDNITKHIREKTDDADLHDKNTDLLMDSLVSVLEKSKTKDSVQITQVISIHSGKAYNTRNLIYRLFQESRINDVSQMYINSLDISL